MSNESQLEPGEVYQLYLTPQQMKQLKAVIEAQPDEGFKRLKGVVASAQTKHRPYPEMTRAMHARWVADEVRELQGEIITLREQMTAWVKSQEKSSFSHTSQHIAVADTAVTLREVERRLQAVRDDLKTCVFPGWNQEKKSSRWDKTHGSDSPLAKELEEKSEKK